jgi:glycosyl transferase family 2
MLSVVVVAYDMARELPRTLHSMSPLYQRGIDASDYEVVLVDNGSPQPVDSALLDGFPGTIRYERIVDAPPSPVHAANRGISLARGDFVGLIVDGARIASPGLFATACLATRLAPRPVITSPAWHLGKVRHMEATDYDRSAEDELLARSGWLDDGYQLFTVSTFANSSGRGWFGPMGESSSLFLPRALWDELGGLDERFSLPGGGLANHDLFHRACSLPDAQLVVLLGEGTFHQFHGGATTSRRFTWDELNAQYRELRGRSYEPPANAPLYLGRVPNSVVPHLEESAQLAIRRIARLAGRPPVRNESRGG